MSDPTDTAPPTQPADPPALAAAVWYIAECQDCEPVLPQPFRTEDHRDNWADEHADFTGHRVERRVEKAQNGA